MSTKNTTKKESKNVLSPDQEQMRLNIVDLELKARFWKAQYDLRYYSLEAEKLQPDYLIFAQAQEDARQKALADYLQGLQNQTDSSKSVTEQLPTSDSEDKSN